MGEVFTPPTVRLRVFSPREDSLEIVGYSDSGRSVLIVGLDRTKRKVKVWLRVIGSNDVYRTACGYEDLDSCISDFFRESLTASQYGHVAPMLSDAVVGIVRNWEDYARADDLVRAEASPLASEPIIETTLPDGTVVRVLESDGAYMPLYGGFLCFDGCSSISEVTPAYTLIERERGIEKITVVGLLVEYDRDLRPTRAEFYYPQVSPTIRVCGRPVRVKVPSKISFVANTYPDVRTLKAAHDAVNGGSAAPNITWAEVGGEILRRIREYIRHDDERVYAVVASYAVMTYFYDVFTAVPYLWFYGPTGSGKTRASITVTYLSRHGLEVESITPASIFRLTDAAGPTLGVDESKLDEESKRILAAGYKKGMVVPRAEPTKDGIVLTLFEAVAPRVFSFIDPPEEGYLRQRCIMINMLKARPLKSEDPTPQEFKEIREKLYLLRLLDLGGVLKAKKEAEEILNSKDVWGREKEIWWPILTAAILIGAKDQVLDIILEDVAEKRTGTYTEEHVVLAAVEALFAFSTNSADDTVVEAHFRASDLQRLIVRQELERQLGDIESACYEERESEQGEKVRVYKGECRRLEEELKRRWSVQRIGRILQRLGFDKYRKKVGKGASARPEYHVNIDGFLDITKRYGYTLTREELKSEESEKSEKLEGGIQEKTEAAGSPSEKVSGIPPTTLPTLPTLPTSHNPPMGRSEKSDKQINSSDLSKTNSSDRGCVRLEEFLEEHTPKEFDSLRREGKVTVRDEDGETLVCYNRST